MQGERKIQAGADADARRQCGGSRGGDLRRDLREDGAVVAQTWGWPSRLRLLLQDKLNFGGSLKVTR